MSAFRRAVLAICFCSLASACASAPISIAASSLPGSGALVTPAHRQLDDAVDDFADQLEDRGLVREASTMDTAMRWMNQLAGQSGEAAPDGLTLYLQVAGIDPADIQAVDIIRADLVETWQGAAAIDAASRRLLTTETGLRRSDVTDALGAVETAMTHAQTAQSVFEAALLELTTHHDAAVLAGLRVERDLLALRVNDLRDRADELADLRRQMRNPSIS
ncbi:hypothetical protein AWH62_07520 [Maricaulis sp. W15]|uniref:hypothetical protein n=1 Tax=Maricaulis sp. W15 TaxID=1772333 RepID=UPI000949175A|nr:hypothetical protein [Maricaulis sp. W15]OLF73988.1 hypothetical protein AWH62_07520 [Maricaulis sp. W15]